jgi:ferritin-like metal-binding protein YciE
MPNERDTKLIQWLNEAYAKEAELEADLTAHIALTQKDSYKKRLRQHLTETKAHKRQVASRIKKLGGKPESSSQAIPGVPSAVGEVAGKAVAAVKGQVGTARAAVTNQTETHLRNAQEELREEHVEMAIYRRIQAFATEVGDRDTIQLTKAIIRDEERMAKFLDAEIGRLVKEVVRSEVPREQRGGTTRRSTSTSKRSTSTSSRSRSTTSSSGSSSSRSASSASRSGSSSGRSGSSPSRSGSSASSGSRSRPASSSSRARTRGATNGSGRAGTRSSARRSS